ncbi:hypothetical protein GL50803_0015011 [Giardia duodenalis]|uniref:Uncharacterized protein n=2 Tax=Giardia intestinalis TaxID=5741 RepID=A8BZJ2_GIAIC|nr:hypothetical protein GL50803_0015011 [Giardia intestinalis]ESU35144.1 Hypothetical protein DHA2_15011 [Giardia intestinalis]KAE8305463.1 hypothetical protein GL50803_0015011 [Giardia intestinalis]|eukprot:XP_001704010.1 Hypothetical protein GL50803_15011 [Giardia lamblia ATCC 50803]
MQYNSNMPQTMGMGAPAGMVAPGPIASGNPYAPAQQPGWQTSEPGNAIGSSGMNLDNSAVNNFRASQPPVPDRDNLGNDDDEYAKARLPVRIPDTYPVSKGTWATVLKCVFSITHFLTCLAFILSIFYKINNGGFEFYWLMCSLFFGFITILFGLCHLDLAIMRKFLDTNPLLLNKWASLVVLSFLCLAYPYNLSSEHMPRFVGSIIMFLVVCVTTVLILYGVIGLFLCPRRPAQRSYV